MKKLVLLASLALIFASCEKEHVAPASPGSTGTLKEQVAGIIGKADPDLYNRIYHPTGKTSEPEILITHGIFVAQQGDIASGTCHPDPNCVCHITIIFPALVTEETGTREITQDYYHRVENPGEMEVVMNASTPYKIEDVEIVDIHFVGDPGESTIDCTVFE